MLTKKLLQYYNPPLTKVYNTFDNSKDRLPEKNYKLNCLRNGHVIQIRVEGLITTSAFHKARLYAQKLSQHLSHKYAAPQIREMFEVDWYEYLQKMKVRVGGKMWILKRHVAVFLNNVFIGSDIEFLDYINELYVFNMLENVEYYEKLIKEYYKEFIQKTKFFDLHYFHNYWHIFNNKHFIEKLRIFHMQFGWINNWHPFIHGISFNKKSLYSDLLPHTCKHFLNLCTGKFESLKGFATSHYLNTSVHRIVKNGWIQLGDIKLDTSSSNMTALPTIPDESYCIPHNRRGVLSLANHGKHSNEFQIIVSLKPNAWMDYYYVAFGQLVDGIHILQKIEDVPTYYESPLKQIIISQCGEYILDEIPKMEAESDIFLERKPWVDVYGESMNTVYQYPFNTYSDMSMWLDNIVDEIHIHDTASLLIAERYLSGLYCLSTDYLSEFSVHQIEKDQELGKEIHITCDLNLGELLINFQPNTMSREDRTIFIEKLCKIIVSYALNSSNNECYARHMSQDDYGTVHQILEYAYDIARAIIAKSLKKDFSIVDTKAEINKLLKTEQHDDKAKDETPLSLVEEILNKSILYSLKSRNIIDSE